MFSNSFGGNNNNSTPFGGGAASTPFGGGGSTPFGGGGNTAFGGGAGGNTAFGGGAGGNTAFGGGGGIGMGTGGALFGGGNNNSIGGGGLGMGGMGGSLGSNAFGANNQQRATSFPASPTLQRQGGGQTNLFGSSLGGGQTQNQPFGASNTTSPFGGANSAIQPFGAAVNQSQPFGAAVNQSQPFGAAVGGGGNMFGGASVGGNAFGGQQQMGTGNPAYVSTSTKENMAVNGRQTTVTNSLHCITAMAQYNGKSLEELRFEDYQKKQGGGVQQQQQPAFGAAAGSGSMFGGAGNNAASPFGGGAAATPFGGGAAASSSPFGGGAGVTAAPFGGGATGAFGVSTGGGGFSFGGGGNNNAATGAFGSTGNAFGAPANNQNKAFGASAAPQFGASNTFGGGGAPAFGSQTSAPAFGQAAGSGGFGSSTPFGQSNAFGGPAAGSTPAFGSTPSMFGNTQQPAATNAFGGGGAINSFGSTATPAFGANPGAFGSTQSTTVPSFGGASSAPAFGATQTTAFGGATSSFSSGFGSATTPAFGSPAGATAAPFGSTTAGGFGTTNTASSSFGAGAGMWGGGAAAKPATTPAFGSGGFGSPQPQAAPSAFGGGGGFGGFGGGAASFGTSASSFGTSSFGQQPQQAGQQPASSFGFSSSFGQQQQQQPQQAAQTGQNVPSYRSASDSGFDVLDKKFNYLHRKKDGLEKNIYGSGSGGSSSTGNKGVDSASDSAKANNAKPLSNSPALYSGGGYRHTPLQQSAIYRSPSLRALSGPQSSQGALIQRSKSNQYLSDSMQYLTPVGNRAGSSGRYSSNDATSVGGSGGLLFSGSGNAMVASTSKHPKRLVIEPVTQQSEVSVDDLCRRAINQQAVRTPNARRSGREVGEDRYLSGYQDAAVVSDDEEDDCKSLSNTNENYSTPAGKLAQTAKIVNSPTPVRHAIPACPPTISRDSGYILSPDINTLRDMDAEELRHVYHFTMLRPKFGKIEWDSWCDLSGLDLDDIVKIEHESVSVYEGQVEKAPIGTGLNKPALITLYNIKPSDQNVQKFVSLLKAVCENDDADFISYDEQNLEWMFKVHHFSRYGLAGAKESAEQAAGTADGGTGAVNENCSGAINSTSLDGQVPAENKTNFNQQVAGPGADDMSMDVVSPGPADDSTANTSRGGGLVATLGFDGGDMNRMMRSSLRSSSPARAIMTGTENSSVPKGSLAITFQKSFYKDPAVVSIDVSGREKSCADLSDTLLKLSREAVLAGFSTSSSFCSAAVKAAELEMGASKATFRAGKRPDAAVLLKQSFRAGFDSWGRLAVALVDKTPSDSSPCSSTLHISHLGVGYRGNDLLYSSDSAPSAFEEYASRDRAGRNNKCFLSCLESLLDVSIVSEDRDADMNHAGTGELKKSSLSSPFWVLPNASPSAGLMSDYVRFVQLVNSIIGNYHHFFKEALTRGSGRPDEPKFFIECMGHDQEWIVLQCVQLLNAVFGQEQSWLARIRSGEESKCLPSMLPCDGEHESCLSSEEEKKQFILTGDGRSDNSILFGRSQIERRRMAISKWLQDVCINFGEQLCGMPGGRDVDSQSAQSQIFDLLSAHRISEAVELAESNGMYRLATLLTQLGGDPDFAFLMRQQLEAWFQSGADEFIDRDVLDIYRLLGSDMSSSGGDVDDVDIGKDSNPVIRNSVLSRVSWVRAIGLLFWYSCSCLEAVASDSSEETFFLTTLTSLQVAMDQYIRAVECGVALEPRSPATASGCEISSSHAIFSLVLYCTSAIGRGERDESLERLIADCTGFTSDPMDHRGSYLVLTLLKCLQRQSADIDTEPAHVSIVRQHVLSELLCTGQWHWAVFVAMQIPNAGLRDAAVKDIVLRYAGGVNWESLDDGFSSFVVDRLHVPDAWVHEATAYRFCSDNSNVTNSSQCLICGGVGAFESAISDGMGEDAAGKARGVGRAVAEKSHSVSFFRNKNMEVAYLGLAGLWGSDRANQIISAITGPYAIFSSTAASEKLLELLLQVEQFVAFADRDTNTSQWVQGSGALLAYLRFKNRYGNVRTVLSEVTVAVALGQDGEFFISARDELCGLYTDAYELLSVLKLRHGKIWKLHGGDKYNKFISMASPNFSTISHVYLCDELFQCLCMLYSVLMSAQFRSAIDADSFPDPLLLVNDPTSNNSSQRGRRNHAEEFPVLTKSYASSMTARLNSILSDRRNALPVDFVGLAV